MKRAVLMTLGAIVSVQFGAAFAKDLFPVAGPLAMAWLRVTTGGLLLAVVVRPRYLRGHSRADWLVLVGYALVLITMNVTFYQAMARIPIGVAVTIEFLGPLGVAIAKSRGVRDVLWVVLAGTGVALLGWSPGELTWAGVILALIAGACWAGYILIVPVVGRRWTGVVPVAYANLFGAVALVVPVMTLSAHVFASPRVWLVGFAVGLLSSVLPYVLEMAALRTLDQRVFSILMSVEPAMGALTALIILGERLTTLEILAMACVMVASVGVTWTAGRRSRDGTGGAAAEVPEPPPGP